MCSESLALTLVQPNPTSRYWAEYKSLHSSCSKYSWTLFIQLYFTQNLCNMIVSHISQVKIFRETVLNFNSLYHFLIKKPKVQVLLQWQSSSDILYPLHWGVGFEFPISHYVWATSFFLLLLWFWTVSPTIPALLEWKSTYLLFLQGITMSVHQLQWILQPFISPYYWVHSETQPLGEYVQESS